MCRRLFESPCIRSRKSGRNHDQKGRRTVSTDTYHVSWRGLVVEPLALHLTSLHPPIRRVLRVRGHESADFYLEGRSIPSKGDLSQSVNTMCSDESSKRLPRTDPEWHD